MDNTPSCCGTKAVYVDNVPSKEYFYCRVCKKEVSNDGDNLFASLKSVLKEGYNSAPLIFPNWPPPSPVQTPVPVVYAPPTPNTCKNDHSKLLVCSCGWANISFMMSRAPSSTPKLGRHLLHYNRDECQECGMSGSEMAANSYNVCFGQMNKPAQSAVFDEIRRSLDQYVVTAGLNPSAIHLSRFYYDIASPEGLPGKWFFNGIPVLRLGVLSNRNIVIS